VGIHFSAPAFLTISLSTTARFSSRSIAKTWPSVPTPAANCVVLFPGAAQASRTMSPVCTSNKLAGIQLALSCRMICPVEYSWENVVVTGYNRLKGRRSGTCKSIKYPFLVSSSAARSPTSINDFDERFWRKDCKDNFRVFTLTHLGRKTMINERKEQCKGTGWVKSTFDFVDFVFFRELDSDVFGL